MAPGREFPLHTGLVRGGEVFDCPACHAGALARTGAASRADGGQSVPGDDGAVGVTAIDDTDDGDGQSEGA
jgi:hypothetical protein